MTQILLSPFREIGRMFFWWIWIIPKRLFAWFLDLLFDVDNALVLGKTIKLWFAVEPLFGDYTWQGRIIGFLFRFVRILISLAIYALVLVGGLATIIAWLLLPVFIFMSIFKLW